MSTRSTGGGTLVQTLLLVEGDVSQAREIENVLRPLESHLHIVDNCDDAVRTVKKDPDITLIIIGAEWVAGQEACDLVERLRHCAGESMMPIIFLTGRDDSAFDIEAVFALGAIDEVPRTRLAWALPAKARFVLDTKVRSHIQNERARAQQADASAEKDRRQSDIIATLAHELRHPLAPMRNGLELMRLAKGDAIELEEVRGMMSRQLDHMVHLVDDMLDITSLSHDKLTLKRERVDLRTILATALETVQPLVEAGQHTLTVDTGDEPMPIHADPVRIAQVIINLLNNATKYTPPGGHIGVNVVAKCDEVHLSVNDTGIGISELALTSVFEMFTQVKRETELAYNGLGVGLALVQRILALHGGTIDAQSAGLGQGSTFCIRLPQATSMTLSPKLDDTQLHRALPGPYRVLVVDDQADARSSFARVLDRQHHVTRQARDGAEALAVAGQFQPEIIFLDIDLPDINGRALAPLLRQLPGLESVVLIALTGHGNPTDIDQSAAAGIDHHLTKPARIQMIRDLLDAISEALPRGGGTSERAISKLTIDELHECIGAEDVALSIVDAQHPDQPVIVVNQAFADLTGYPMAEVVGRNCRFLQGRNREQKGRRLLANAIKEGRDIEVFMHNVRRSGESFSNLLRLYMVPDTDGVIRYILGSQLRATPAPLTAHSASEVTSRGGVDVLERRHTDVYPARLPQRYWPLYDISRRSADEAAALLRERVAGLGTE